MMSTETTENRGIFSLRESASCAHFFFRFICEKGKRVKSDNEELYFETCHDRRAHRMVKKGLEFQIQTTLAVVSR